jgi:hypothetical protein
MRICKLKGCYEEVNGRSDKEFCCDVHRSANNNAINKKLFDKLNKRFNNTKSTYKCLQLMYPLSKGVNPIDIEVMYSNKFKKDTYYKVRSDSNDPDGRWICIEDYGYRQISKTEFLIDKTENNDRK